MKYAQVIRINRTLSKVFIKLVTIEIISTSATLVTNSGILEIIYIYVNITEKRIIRNMNDTEND